MGKLWDDVYLGTLEKYNQKLELLSKMAQPEKWTYKKIQNQDPYKILRNYIQFTYGPYLLGKLTNRCSAVGISPQPVGN